MDHVSEEIRQSSGYRSLLEAVEHDEKKSPGFHDYRAQLAWVIERAEHYAEVTGLKASEILDAWEEGRTYWYMNYYQESNQPLLNIEGKQDTVRVFDTVELATESMRGEGFRCPSCSGVSPDAYRCEAEGDCNWSSSGFFKTMGKGAYVFLKDKMVIQEIFMPVAWENDL